MHNENFHDDIVFDRMVDGELSAAERRTLLESLDARPDGWRRCALAFLEAQSWADDLRQFVREPAVSVRRVDMDRRAVKNGIAWLAIAASLLVAFTLVLMQRDESSEDGLPIASAPAANESIADIGPSSVEQSNADDSLTFWVRDEIGQPRSLRVPLLDAGTLDPELGVEFQTGLPADMRAQLRDRGYDVQSKRRYAPLWLEDGRRMIFPVEDTKIVPVSQNVY